MTWPLLRTWLGHAPNSRWRAPGCLARVLRQRSGVCAVGRKWWQLRSGAWARFAGGRVRAVAGFAGGCFVFGVALLSRLYGIESRSIWMDEDAQARRVLAADFSFDLVRRAAEQQQPPLDYIAQYIGFELFGVTPFGARVHAAVFGALAVLCFYRLSKRVFGGRLPVYFGTALMLLHPMLIYYSQEGRPIACGVFFGTLFLSQLHGFVMLAGALWRRALRGFGLLASTWCFLLSVGMQPSVLITTAAIGLFPALFLRTLRFRVAGAWAILVAAVGLAWPVLAAVIARSPRYLQKEPLAERLLRLFEKLSAAPFAAWQSQLGHLLEPLWPPVLLLVVLGAIGWVSDVRHRRQPEVLRLTGFCALLTLSFPWLLAAIFAALVKWPLKPRYYATLVPVVLLLLALLLHHAIPIVTQIANRSRSAKLAVLATLVTVASWTCLLQGRATLQGYTQQKPDYAALYTLFKHNRRRGVAYMLSLRRPGDSEHGYYAERFYYKGADSRLVRLSLAQELRRDFARARLLSKGSVYVQVMDGWQRLQPLARDIEQRVPGATFHGFYGVSVVELRPTKHGKAALRQLFEVLAERLKATPASWRVYETLAWLRFEDGDREGAHELAQRLQKIDPLRLKRNANEILRALKLSRKYAENRRAKRTREPAARTGERTLAQVRRAPEAPPPKNQTAE